MVLRGLLLTLEAAPDVDVDNERAHDGDSFAHNIEHFVAQVQTEIYGPADPHQQGASE